MEDLVSRRGTRTVPVPCEARNCGCLEATLGPCAIIELVEEVMGQLIQNIQRRGLLPPSCSIRRGDPGCGGCSAPWDAILAGAS